MASYKVIQDVEAEDKLLGPLTLRQFIYAFIAGTCVFLSYYVVSHGAAFMIVVFIPPALVSSFFAFPWGKEQSTEIWALARIRFLFMPRKRIWNQSGLKELVTVTVPKRMEQIYTDGLSQNEVRSRLKTLANTIDSRGWAVKSIVDPFTPSFATGGPDRLLGMSSLPKEVPTVGTESYMDVFDPANNQLAQQFNAKLQQNSQNHHQQLVAALQQPMPEPPQANPYPQTIPSQAADTTWFVNQAKTAGSGTIPTFAVPTPPQPTQSDSAADEKTLVEALRQREPGPAYEYSHLPTILPLAESERLAKQESERQAAIKIETDKKKSTSTMTVEHDAAILELARNNDRNIDSIAREAKKDNDNEVVISLH